MMRYASFESILTSCVPWPRCCMIDTALSTEAYVKEQTSAPMPSLTLACHVQKDPQSSATYRIET